MEVLQLIQVRGPLGELAVPSAGHVPELIEKLPLVKKYAEVPSALVSTTNPNHWSVVVASLRINFCTNPNPDANLLSLSDKATRPGYFSKSILKVCHRFPA